MSGGIINALGDEVLMIILANKKEALIGGAILLSLVVPGMIALAKTTTAKLGIALVCIAATAQNAIVATRRSDNRRSRAGLTDFGVIEAEGLSAGVVMLFYDNEMTAKATLSEVQGLNILELASLASAAIAIKSSAVRSAIHASLDQISAVEAALGISCKRRSSRVWPTEQQDQEQQLAQNFLPQLEALTKSNELAMNPVSATASQIFELLTPAKPATLAVLTRN